MIRIDEKLKRTNTNVQLHIMSKKKKKKIIAYVVHCYFNSIVLRNETQPVVCNLK